MDHFGTYFQNIFKWPNPLHWIRNAHSGSSVHVPDWDFEFQNLKYNLNISERLLHSGFCSDVPIIFWNAISIPILISTHNSDLRHPSLTWNTSTLLGGFYCTFFCAYTMHCIPFYLSYSCILHYFGTNIGTLYFHTFVVF